MISSDSSSSILPADTDTRVPPFDPTLRDFWVEVLRGMEAKLQRSQFITWFKDTAALGCEDGTLIVGLPLPMFLGWHMEHYRTMTRRLADIEAQAQAAIDDALRVSGMVGTS